MIRLIPVAAMLAVAGLAASARAIPPAPEVAVLIVSPSGVSVEDSELLLAQMAPDHGGGWFKRVPPALAAADFAACQGVGDELERCIRGVLAERGAAELAGPPTVVVALSPGPGFTLGWTCVGVGDEAVLPDRQRISIDFMTLQATGSDPAAASAGAGCVTAAAAESGW